MQVNDRSSELCHWGIKGMKWGVRRYQNKDGSLTPAGKKRAAKLESQYRKVTGKSPNQNKSEPVKNKTVKEMSDAELRAKINRMQLEKEYLGLQPKQVSRGQAVVKRIAKDIITPAAISVGKQVATSMFTKMANETLNLQGDLKVHTNNKKKS